MADIPVPEYNKNQLIGALIQVVGSSVSIIGLNAQKWAMEVQDKLSEEERASSCASWRWTLALGVFTLGQIIQTAAYAYGSQSLVSAVSNLSLVTNALIATLVFDEPFTMRPVHGGLRIFEGWDLGAIVVLIIGTVLAGLYAPPATEAKFDLVTLQALFLQTHFLVWLGITVFILLFALTWWIAFVEPQLTAAELDAAKDKDAKRRSERALRTGGMLFSFAAAAIGSISVTLSKIVVLLIKESIEVTNQFTNAAAFIFVVGFIGCAVLSLLVLNAGLARFEAVIVIPVYYVLSTILIIVSGELLYNTYLNFTETTATLFSIGIAISLFGVYLLSCHEGTSIAEPEGRGRSATAPIRYLRQGRRSLGGGAAGGAAGGGGGASPRAQNTARPQRRQSAFGGVVNARTRYARTSSIDFMVGHWGAENNAGLAGPAAAAAAAAARRSSGAGAKDRAESISEEPESILEEGAADSYQSSESTSLIGSVQASSSAEA